MKFTTHQTNNDVLRAPKHSKNVDDLPITRTRFVDGAPCVMSFWKPNEEELERMKLGEPIVLVLQGVTHPPLMLALERDVFTTD